MPQFFTATFYFVLQHIANNHICWASMFSAVKQGRPWGLLQEDCSTFSRQLSPNWHFSSPSASYLFPELLFTASFHSSVSTFLNLNLKIYSQFLQLEKKEPFLISHLPFLPQFTVFVLTHHIFNLPILYKTFSHCPYKIYVNPNFSCLLHFLLLSFPQGTSQRWCYIKYFLYYILGNWLVLVLSVAISEWTIL